MRPRSRSIFLLVCVPILVQAARAGDPAGAPCPPGSKANSTAQFARNVLNGPVAWLLHGEDGLSARQLIRIEQLTTAFENGTTTFRYDYVTDLGDGRGFTAGRVGFCTGTGDLLEVVARYTKLQPKNPLTRYLPELRRLDALNEGPGSDRISGLPGFPKAWKEASQDPLFRKAQDDEVEDTYLKPALADAKASGIQSALGKGLFYDTVVEHGGAATDDGLLELIHKTNRRMKGSPSSGVDEAGWLAAFIGVRRHALLHAQDPKTRKAWADSVDRVTVYKALLQQKNFDLTGPIQFEVFGDKYEIQ